MPIQPYQIAPAPIQQNAQVGVPALPAGSGTFYAKVVGGITEAFYANGSGQDIQLTTNGEMTAIAAFEKKFVNNGGSIIASGVPVAIVAADGSILAGNAAVVAKQDPVGITLQSIAASGGIGKVALFGRNLPGVLTGMGFLPGDEIFLGPSSGGITNDETSLVNSGNESVIRIGVAACADGITGAVATDLILYKEVESLQP